jgi:hypothetical protein
VSDIAKIEEPKQGISDLAGLLETGALVAKQTAFDFGYNSAVRGCLPYADLPLSQQIATTWRLAERQGRTSHFHLNLSPVLADLVNDASRELGFDLRAREIVEVLLGVAEAIEDSDEAGNDND